MLASGGVVCLTGIGSSAGTLDARDGDPLANEIVLQNKIIAGSVNANRRHYYKAAGALRARRPRLARSPDHPSRPRRQLRRRAARQPDDIKAVIEFAS